MATIEKRWISGFWRRIAALVADSIALGVVGFVLGQLFESVFVEMGSWGRLVGFAISLAYFGLMNSAIYNGQTIGKRLLKIRVVDDSNSTISLGRSLIRYVILGTPFFLNALQFTGETLPAFAIYPIYIVVFGGIMSILYLYLFNTVSRQSLHDLLVGTYVVNADQPKQELGPLWKGHSTIIGLLLLIAAAIPFVSGNLNEKEVFKNVVSNDQLQLASQALMDNPVVNAASVNAAGFTSLDENGVARRSTFISSSLLLRENNVGDEALAKKLAKVVLTTYPDAKDNDLIMMVMSYGYDIGIFASWSHRQYSFHPEDLQ